MINMLKALMKNADNIQIHMSNFSTEIETIRKYQREC